MSDVKKKRPRKRKVITLTTCAVYYEVPAATAEAIRVITEAEDFNRRIAEEALEVGCKLIDRSMTRRSKRK